MKRKDFSHSKIQNQKEIRAFFEHEHFIAGVVPFTRGNSTSTYFQEIKIQDLDFKIAKNILSLNTHKNTENSIVEALIKGSTYLKKQLLNETNTALSTIVFEQQAQGDTSLEIAKIKAVRTLWSKILITIFKIENEKIEAIPIFYQMKTDAISEIMTAIFCGIQYIYLPKNSIFSKEEMDYFVKEELSITQVTDPWGGSVTIEKEVDRLVKNCWEKMEILFSE